MILFSIQLILLAARDVTTILPGVTLFLPTDVAVFSRELIVVPAKVSGVSVDSVLFAISATKYLCSTWVILPKSILCEAWRDRSTNQD
jgi:hypothetical protein